MKSRHVEDHLNIHEPNIHIVDRTARITYANHMQIFPSSKRSLKSRSAT